MITRRTFLRALGLGTAAAALPAVLVPERKLWFVSRDAPVGSRFERVASTDLMFGNGYTLATGKAFTLGNPVPRTFAGRMQLVDEMMRGGALNGDEVNALLGGDSGSLFGLNAMPNEDWKACAFAAQCEVLNGPAISPEARGAWDLESLSGVGQQLRIDPLLRLDQPYESAYVTSISSVDTKSNRLTFTKTSDATPLEGEATPRGATARS